MPHLRTLLTRPSLRKRFTHTGESHVNAFEHLRQRGLKEMAESSELNELGERIRAYLIEPFRKAHLQQLFGKGVPGPSTNTSPAITLEKRHKRGVSLFGLGGTH